jgi:hypothetical protein
MIQEDPEYMDMKTANMALRMQTQRTVDKGRGDRMREMRKREQEKRRKEAEKAKKKKEKEQAKAKLKKYKEEHPKTKKTIGDFVKSLFGSEDCGCGCDGAGTCQPFEEEFEIETPCGEVEVEVEFKPRYRNVGEVTNTLLAMAKEVLGEVEEIGNERNESEEHEPNE